MGGYMTESIRLTKNEKKTLKMLLANSRMSDSDIASELKISSQAVGNIRRKLEKNIISSYSVNLDYAKLGIHTFAIAIARLTRQGMDMGELGIEQILLNNEHVIDVFRIPRGSSTHILVYGFRDINELDTFFHNPAMKDELHKYLEIQDMFTFSHNSLLKNSPVQLFHKIIDNLDAPDSDVAFAELEKFKRKLV